MSTDSFALLFVGAFVSWLVLGILYSFHVGERKPARKVPVVRIVTRGRIRVKVVPLAYRPPERMPVDVALDDFYQGCYESIIRSVEDAKDNL